jgi:hypothetical protein
LINKNSKGENRTSYNRYEEDGCFKQQADDLFILFNRDSDSRISPLELQRGMKATLGEEVLATKAEALVASVDLDSHGYLDIAEFVRLVARAEVEVVEERHLSLIVRLIKNDRFSSSVYLNIQFSDNKIRSTASQKENRPSSYPTISVRFLV